MSRFIFIHLKTLILNLPLQLTQCLVKSLTVCLDVLSCLLIQGGIWGMQRETTMLIHPTRFESSIYTVSFCNLHKQSHTLYTTFVPANNLIYCMVFSVEAYCLPVYYINRTFRKVKQNVVSVVLIHKIFQFIKVFFQ